LAKADLTMDYQSLLTEAMNEMAIMKKELEDRLMRFSPWEITKLLADAAENLNRALKMRALPRPVRYI
jgi:hypothetical protein